MSDVKFAISNVYDLVNIAIRIKWENSVLNIRHWTFINFPSGA